MYKINVDFKVNTKVYFVKMVEMPHVVTCPMCLGDKYLYRKNETEVKCPKCNGLGTTSDSGGLTHSVNSGNLHKIVCIINEDCISFEYYVDLDGNSDCVKVHTIFKTKQEAFTECEKANKTAIMGYYSM